MPGLCCGAVGEGAGEAFPESRDHPLKVAHLITGLDTGGAELFLQRLISLRTGSGIEHRVISLTTEGAIGGALREAGIQVDALVLAGGAGLPSALARLVALLRRDRPDVLMTWLYHADLLGTVAAALVPGVRLLWNIRCSDMDLSQYRWTTRILPRLLGALSRRPDAIVTNSHMAQEIHRRYGYRPRRWQVIPNGFDMEQFRPDPIRRARVRSCLGLAEDTSVVGLFARVDPMKDHRTFLDAAEKVVKVRQDARFLLVGRGTDEEGISRMIEGRPLLEATLMRLGERRDVADLMSAVDLAVSSSLTESFPNVMGEAMACGVPCVATAVGDTSVLVGDTGTLVPRGSPDALARAILDYLALPSVDRRTRGAAARKRIEDLFSLSAVVSRYEAMLRERRPL